MYEAFYGLSVDPFRLSPDHRFRFLHPSYKKARAYMSYALTRAEGFVVVTGWPGTGKTTLINDLLSDLDATKVTVARLATTQLQGEDFLRAVGYAFGIDSQGLDQATLLRDIERFLLALNQGGRSALLVVDEAQDLQTSALTELRLLSNMQSGSVLLMHAFLIGQERLARIIGMPEMEQFRQRIIAACHLQPLTLIETRSYIEHRISCAGWQGDPGIDGGVFHHIHRFSRGIPRQINLICSRLFLQGCVEERHRITVDDALTVIEELKSERLGPTELVDAEMVEGVPNVNPAVSYREGRGRERRVQLRDGARVVPAPTGHDQGSTPDESPDGLSPKLTPVASASGRRSNLANGFELDEPVVDSLTTPALVRPSGPPSLDDLEMSEDVGFRLADGPGSSERKVRPEASPLPSFEATGQIANERSTREDLERTHSDAAKSARDLPILPNLPEPDPVAGGGAGSAATVVRRRRWVLVGVFVMALLLAIVYAQWEDHLEAWAGGALEWFETQFRGGAADGSSE